MTTLLRRIARVLGEFAGRALLYERTRTCPGRSALSLALHVGGRRPSDLKRLGVVAKVDADLLENGIGVVLHEREAFLVEHLVVGNLAR